MLTLQTGQTCFSEPEWTVLVGGDYAPSDSVECSRIGHEDQVVAYIAQFIVDGTYPE
jgi:hypothetical protein